VHARRLLDTIAAFAFAICLVTAPQPARGALQSEAPHTASKTKPVPPPEDRIDINRASVDELLKVHGMTPSWAGRIVRFRPYRTKQDLLDRGIVTSEVYDRIKDYVIAHRDKE
jgi:DNA uptake protein ComE-like DNA-binding protein